MLNRVDKNEKRQNVISVLVDILSVLLKTSSERIPSLSNIYAQVINDETGETIAAASTVEKI